VLTEAEVSPVITKLAAGGIEVSALDLDTAVIDQTLGAKGTNSGSVYQFSIPRGQHRDGVRRPVARD